MSWKEWIIPGIPHLGGTELRGWGWLGRHCSGLDRALHVAASPAVELLYLHAITAGFKMHQDELFSRSSKEMGPAAFISTGIFIVQT